MLLILKCYFDYHNIGINFVFGIMLSCCCCCCCCWYISSIYNSDFVVDAVGGGEKDFVQMPILLFLLFSLVVMPSLLCRCW